jgi:hypothetical protein
MSDLERTHALIFALQAEMKDDKKFRDLCERHGLPWDFERGYEPRWYNGPPPEQVKVLILMAEPAAITPTEARNLGKPISHGDWIASEDKHYWRANLRDLCRHIWPVHTEDNMYERLGVSCSFWMSLPPEAPQTKQIPSEPVIYFVKTYLRRFLTIFPPSAVILAAGVTKAAGRLKILKGVQFEQCRALTKPESVKPSARTSWRDAGEKIKQMLERSA